MNAILPQHPLVRVARVALAPRNALPRLALLAAALPCAAPSTPAQVSPGSPAVQRVAQQLVPFHDYVLTPLGSDAVAIDAEGRVAVNQGTLAYRFTPVAPHAPVGELAPLGTLGGSVSVGKGINALGHIAGFSTLSTGAYRAALAAGGELTSIGTLGSNASSGTGINDAGQIVGFSYDASNDEHGFLWTPEPPNGTSGTMLDLGTLGGEYSSARGINGAGVVVGFAYTPQGAFHAFRWAAGHMADLGTLGGAYSKADAINGQGLIVGQAYLPGNAQAHACLWDATGIHDLGHLGGSYSEALAIDPTGKAIVGEATVPAGAFLQYHAFLRVNGQMLDLNDALPPGTGWVLERASGVNAHGQIVGRGTLHGQSRGFLLTPS